MANTTEHNFENTMEYIFAPADFQDIEFDMMSSSVAATLTAAALQDFDFEMMSSEMEPPLAAPGGESFEFSTISNTVDPGTAATGLRDVESNMMSNILDPTLVCARFQGLGLYTTSNATEPALAIAGVQPPGFCTMSNAMKSTFVVADQDFELSTKSSVRSTPARGDWVSKDEWAPVRPLIKRLYVDEDKTLKEVMTIMEKEHGFRATSKMYKDRIKTWHFNKNLKQNEIAAILRKKAQRDRMGKQSSFQVRGRVVSIEKIDRSFRRRKGITLDMLLTKQAQVANPPDITCWTPPLSPRSGYEVPRSPSTPHSLAKPEQLFYNIDRYMSVSFNNKIWVEDGDGYLINAFTGQEDGGFLDYFFNYCSTSADFAENQLFVETRRILSKACTLVPSILKAEHPQTVENLLENFLNLISQGLREYVTQLMDYISEMARVLLPAEHPLGQICRLMGGIEPSYLEQTLIRSYECLIKTYVQCVGESDERSLWAQTQLIDYSTSDQGLFIAEQRLRRFYSQCTEATTIFSFSSINVLHSLAYNLRRQGKYIQAEMTSLELLNNAREAGYLVFQVTGLEEVAKAQFRQGKIDLAEKNVQEALELIENHWEESDPWALRRVVRLESLLQDYGLEQEAAELEMEWERRMKLCEITDEE